MADHRQFEKRFEQTSKSEWFQSRINFPKSSNQHEDDREIEAFTGGGAFSSTENRHDALNDFTESSDVSSVSEHWTLPWSDLMMTVFVLFAVLLSVHVSERNVVETAHAKVEVSKEKTPAKQAIDFPSGEVQLSAEKIYRLSHQAVRMSNLEQVEVIFEEDKTVRISVRGPLFFDSGNAALRDDTKLFLEQLLPVLQKIDNEIHIVGHTDDLPVNSAFYASNWELSAIRASNVAKYLIKRGFLAPGRFSIIGRSMYQPERPNITEENRQMNRRVDIIITRKHYDGI